MRTIDSTAQPTTTVTGNPVHVEVTTIAEVITLTQIGGSSVRDVAPIDADLADHVRSELGPIVKELDLPHVHVMAEGRHVMLHGDVSSLDDAVTIEAAVLAMPVVDSIESHLHLGLLPSDTRPSESPIQHSPMYDALIAAAERAKVDHDAQRYAIHGALAALLDVIPHDERDQVLSHFPDDVKALATPRRRLGETYHGHSVLDVEIATSLRGGIPLAKAEKLVPSVVGVIRSFVPEEDADVQATLGRRLRAYWKHQPRRAR